jgi:TetR/AcrR family transcriptional regulator, cholesterol catabolism regulator
MAKRVDENGRVDEVVEAALQLFMERGYDNAPMSLLARRLGLTKAGLYHHFDSKEDLLFVAHRTAMQRQLGPLFAAAEKQPDPERRLRTFLHDYARMLALEPTAGLMIREARRLSSNHLKEIRKTWRRGLDLVRGAIVAMQRSGRCRTDVNPTFAAFAAIGMANWICYWFDPKRPDGADAVAKTIADLFMSGLTAGTKGRAPSRPSTVAATQRRRRQLSRKKEERSARKRRSS